MCVPSPHTTLQVSSTELICLTCYFDLYSSAANFCSVSVNISRQNKPIRAGSEIDYHTVIPSVFYLSKCQNTGMTAAPLQKKALAYRVQAGVPQLPKDAGISILEE